MTATAMSLPASGSGSEVGFIQEVTYGTTPASPDLTRVRTLPALFDPDAENFISEEINNLRVPSAIRRTYEGASVNIPTELSYGNVDEWLASVVQDDWQTDTPVVGSQQIDWDTVIKTHSMELGRLDAETPYYLQALGVYLNAFTLEISADQTQAVRCNFTGRAKSLSAALATMDQGGGYTAAPTNEPILSRDCTLQLDASGISLVGVTLNMQNPVDAVREIGDATAAAYGATQLRSLTGTLTGYARNKDQFDRWKNETDSALDILMTDTGGNTLQFLVPNFKVLDYSEDQAPGLVRFTSQIQAFNPNAASPLQIIRNPV